MLEWLYEKDEAEILNENIDNQATLLWRYNINSFLCECSFDNILISQDGSIIAVEMSVAESPDKAYFFNRGGKRLWVCKYLYGGIYMSPNGTFIALKDLEMLSIKPKIKLFSHWGNPVWSYKLQNCYGISIPSGNPYVAVEGFGDFYILNMGGQLLWSHNKVAHISITSDGSCIAAGSYDEISKNHSVSFFKQDGTLLWSHNIIGVIQSVSVSSDGSYIAVATRIKLTPDFSLNSLQKPSQFMKNPSYTEYYEVHFFNREGTLLWNNKIDCIVQDVSVSSDGSVVIIKGFKTVFFFDREGKHLWSHKSHDIEIPYLNVSTSSDCSYVALKDKDTVYLFNRDGKTLWNHRTGNRIGHVFISSDGSFIAMNSQEKIFFFNRDGKLLWNYKIKGLRGFSATPDGSYIAAWKGNKMYFIRTNCR